MGGKGRKRREKNYRAAHGGFNRLPPPPNPSAIDALPSKLRTIMSLTTGSGKVPEDIKKRADGGTEKIQLSDDKNNTKLPKNEDRSDDEVSNEEQDATLQDSNSTQKKRKAKRKRKQVNDLRFEATGDMLGVGSKRKERKKKYLEERKKKHKKAKREENLEFPGREKIEFGDIVEAPPKLVKLPKAFKTAQDASKERLRLKAVEAYRERKGWASRPGLHLPPPVTMSPSG